MNKIIYIAIIAIVAIAAIWYTNKSSEPLADNDAANSNEVMEVKSSEDVAMAMDKMDAPTEDVMMKKMDETEMAMEMTEMKAMTFDYSGTLEDVTDGKSIRGLSTSGAAIGEAKASFSDGKYSLMATFENLPDPKGGEFYEGWVVRKSPFDFISTGELQKVDGMYINTYTSGSDLTAYSFYVLTVEPDDGDPAPADHIVEGTMTKQ
jgi:hypothetical protein